MTYYTRKICQLKPIRTWFFWGLMLGYVTPLDWYLDFLMVRLYLKHLSILTPHFLDCDLNVKILTNKCIWRYDVLY
jgi:hypothetical protein